LTPHGGGGGGGDGGFVLNGMLLNKCTKHSLKQNQVHPRRITHGNKHTKNKKETNKTNTHTHTHKQRTFDETINQASKNQTNKQINKQQKRGLCVYDIPKM
jgi:phosphorylcholine metabolism protein LicD